jgi:hypothetical protein
MHIRSGRLEQSQSSVQRRISWTGGLLSFVLLFGLEAMGCGGSSGTGLTVPPSMPAFTTIDAPGAGSEGTFAVGINANGSVVGYFFDVNHAIHGFAQGDGGASGVIDVPEASSTTATAINASGTIVGIFVAAGLYEHSFILTSDGTLNTFDPPGAEGSATTCINDAGTAAGGYIDVNGAHGFIRANDGTFTSVDIPGIPANQVQIVAPNQINASGTVAGSYRDSGGVYHGFVRTPDGTITVLDAPGAGTTAGLGTYIWDINSSGSIVGLTMVTPVGGVNTSHSFVRAADGTYTTFDPPGAGANGSLADGINDNGAIVGLYVDSSVVAHGYLREPDGGFTSFDAPGAAQLPESSGNLGTAPRRINASGTIVGLFSDAAGTRHGFTRSSQP